ncbi:branched-chain amino acid ABC transporter permease [Streptomyces fuscigenes]|uniref:branched-chain amino acid ABC transporter permease n=1 Tax=Streptomyces fuscigenes TaxID=1528880 RepID=UPI001F2E7D57|nr:branched-chain amino acid ABC transporter permease [Streptomyces fuscigenes]MCF3962260.1 branched-chain amino acid ABC transporter permease [Streptomyces fuscigenes]
MTTTATTGNTPAPAAEGPGPGVLPLPETAADALVLLGGLATVVSAFMSWTWTSDFPGDLTVYGYPAGLQIIAIVGGVLTVLFGLSRKHVRGLAWLNPARATNPVFLAALSAFVVTWFAALAIAVDLGGLVNLDPGAYVAVVGGLLALLGALGLPHAEGRLRGYFGKPDHLPRAALPAPWLQRLLITLCAALALLAFSYGIGINDDDSETFIGFALLVVFAAWALNAAGLFERFSELNARHQGFATGMAFLAAVAFPFTQSDDHNANLGVNILIFGTVALGLNIVVGLTGLLDLGYVAFLGVGAYAAALVSGSQYSSIHIQFPFWAAALTGMAASLVFGVLIGAPTLRLRGDYLAIVTLGFGEIFRIAVNNLDGSSGPDVTNGPNGISNIPDLKLFGFNFGEGHDIGGFTIGRFANYFFLMLLFTAIVVFVFKRAADSRIGRSWVAIREDETAATAMGINGFRVKLIAFALGATLAGLAGTVSAHVTYSVVPTPYQFAGAAPPNSAFLLAAVVLGGMGTVGGPILGAVLLYLIPEKLGFLQNYELLAFGIALILLMRFRPEGIIPNRRRQLEFHETGQLDVPEDGLPPGTVGATKAEA